MPMQEQAHSLMNEWGRQRRPFFFWVSYDGRRVLLSPDDAPLPGLAYRLPGASHMPADFGESPWPESPFFRPEPPSPDDYAQAFAKVHRHLMRGDSYLLNLTFPTLVDSNLTPDHFFSRAEAPYRAYYRNGDEEFVCFSPEPFISISGRTISTHPMKGTISTLLPDAEQLLLNNEKETREHATIVDLMRNDLSRVARNVRLARYRYVERVATSGGGILQSSSEICGELPDDWAACLGSILSTLLPAGSITGAPKEWTCRAIDEAETYDRGFYTGVFGHFSGTSVVSAVAIRFIERCGSRLVYKSGGGITVMSDPVEEYQELLQKVYVPFVF